MDNFTASQRDLVRASSNKNLSATHSPYSGLQSANSRSRHEKKKKKNRQQPDDIIPPSQTRTKIVSQLFGK